MDLSKLSISIKENYYGSTNAFESDTKWVLHNSIIFNSCKLLFANDEGGTGMQIGDLILRCNKKMSWNCAEYLLKLNALSSYILKITLLLKLFDFMLINYFVLSITRSIEANDNCQIDHENMQRGNE